jgi:hypothetical protein
MKYAAWLLLFGACADSMSGVEQQVADPAPTLSITSANFHSAIGGTSVSYCSADTTPCFAIPPSQVRWGSAVDGINQSGLGWDFVLPHVVTYGSAFDIGSLTHFNFPTYAGTWASGVSLDLHVLVEPSVPGPALFDEDITIPFTIHETTNQDPCI